MSAAITILAGFARNAAFLLSLAFLYSLILPGLRRLQPKSRTALSGALFGLIAILGMLTPIQVEPGLIFGGRLVVVALAAVFEGTGAGLITTALVMAFRSWLGGVGTFADEGAILTSFLLGALVLRRWGARLGGLGPKQFLLLGAGLAVSGLLWTLMLPDPLLARRVFRMLAFPVGLGFPVATLLLGTLLSQQIRRHEAEDAVTRAREELEQRVADRTTELSKSNALLQGEIAERKRAEERLAKLNECLLGFGVDPNENINRLVAVCGKQLGATCALYNRLEGGKLLASGQWNVPADFTLVDTPDGHICYDVIRGSRSAVHVIRNLPATVYAHTDPTVLRYGLKTYVGKPVSFGEAFAGSLCVLYCEDWAPSDEDLKFLGIVASAIAVEEERKRAEDKIRETELRYRTLFEQSPAGVLVIDPETTAVLEYNDRVCSQLGYSRDEFTGMRISDFEVIEKPEETRARIENILGTGGDEFETRHRTKQGEIRNVLVTVQAIALSGRPVLHCVFHDITERKRAEEALVQRTQQLDAIRVVTAEITSELNLTTLLDLILRRALELVGAASGTIYLWDEADQVLVPQTWQSPYRWLSELRLRPGEGVAGTVAQRRCGMIVNDFRTSPYATPFLLERTTHTAVLAEPLLYHGRLLGVVAINNAEIGRPFTDQDQSVIALFASQVAIAIENARLHASTQRWAQELATLNELARRLTTTLEPEQVAREILTAVQVLLPGAVGRLWELKDKGVLHLVGSVGLRQPEGASRDRFPMGEGLTGIAAATGQPVTSFDVTQDPRFANRPWAAAEGLMSCIILHLVRGDAVTGSLGIWANDQIMSKSP